jgi:hypothetical protein
MGTCSDAVFHLTLHGLSVQLTGSIEECVQDGVDTMEAVRVRHREVQRYDTT